MELHTHAAERVDVDLLARRPDDHRALKPAHAWLGRDGHGPVRIVGEHGRSGARPVALARPLEVALHEEQPSILGEIAPRMPFHAEHVAGREAERGRLEEDLAPPLPRAVEPARREGFAFAFVDAPGIHDERAGDVAVALVSVLEVDRALGLGDELEVGTPAEIVIPQGHAALADLVRDFDMRDRVA